MNKRIKPLVLVVAKSGVGKSYIVNKICEDFNKREVISRTTRKPRFQNESTHVFVSNEQADKEFNNSIAKTIFDRNRYYTLEEDLEGRDIYIIDPRGVKSMKDKGIDFKTVYINANLITRIKQMRKRGDKWINILIRIIHDFFAFYKFKGDINLTSNTELYYYFMNGIL